MLIIVAATDDFDAWELAQSWSHVHAACLTPSDLSAPGWRFLAGDPAAGQAVVSGRIVSQGSITGVLTRLPWVSPDHLPWIAKEDRVYAAAEMSAFLLAWLSALSCPVVNRPSFEGLGGAIWRRERWTAVAARIGIPVTPVTLCSTPEAPFTPPAPLPASTRATVVGGRVVEGVSSTLAGWTLSLADAAQLPLLVGEFTGVPDDPLLCGVHLLADVANPDVADAILSYLVDAS
jgi:hypothetical protein